MFTLIFIIYTLLFAFTVIAMTPGTVAVLAALTVFAAVEGASA